MNLFASIGQIAMTATNEAGRVGMFTFEFLRQVLKRPFYLRLLFKQFEKIGVDSIPIVVLTAFFTGGVLALQSYNGFGNAAIAANSLGSVVALSMLRELGPVLASLMVAGRVGAAMAAEIGTMKVTEQVDALYTLATNPVRYLVVPRVVACMLAMPLLVGIANVIGIFGGYLVATKVLHLSAVNYLHKSFAQVGADDISLSLTKAICFGAIIGLMGCYHGYRTNGGAEGVGRATTIAVVYASVLILISDYVITALMFNG